MGKRNKETDEAVHIPLASLPCVLWVLPAAGLALTGLWAGSSQPHCRVGGNAGGTLALLQGAAVWFAAWLLLLP